MGKHTGGIPFAALKEIKGRFSTLFATQKGDCREAIAFLRGNMKQEKHEIRCSEIEKRLGKCCFFEKSYKNTRTKKRVIRMDGPLFGTSGGTRKGGGSIAVVKNMPVACFLARGRVPGSSGAPCKGVNERPAP